MKLYLKNNARLKWDVRCEMWDCMDGNCHMPDYGLHQILFVFAGICDRNYLYILAEDITVHYSCPKDTVATIWPWLVCNKM